MNVLIVPDKFKGSLSALEVCDAIKDGASEFDDSINIEIQPLADGGEGTIDIISTYVNCEKREIKVRNPIGEMINAEYLFCGKSAYIELAKASGLILLDKKDRNPLYTDTFGTGQLILDAIDLGAKEINVFVGGSASNDAAMGIAVALGIRFLDSKGQNLAPIGINLNRISKIYRSGLKFTPQTVEFNIFSDVSNVMYGENGAAHSFAGQKGASNEDILFLDEGLSHFANVLKSIYNVDVSNVEGGGAAGAVVAGMKAMFNAKIRSGIDEIVEITQLENKIKNADLVVTGEGGLDKYSFKGKVVGKVLELVKKYDKKAMVFAGQNLLNKSFDFSENNIAIDSVLSYTTDIEDAIQNASYYLKIMMIHGLNSLKKEKKM